MTEEPTRAVEKETVSAVHAALARQIDAERIVTEPPELATAAALWNGAMNHRPALVVHCETTAEVQHAIRTAREFGFPVSVRGGGHDWAGRAIRAGGLVIDLTHLRGVSVHGGIATVEGGATVEDVAAAADKLGLAVAAGTVGAVGMTGLTLAGGYGPLCGRFGLAADNLVGAEVVLADGHLAHAGSDDDPDLLWALRGGGGNFGVVTSVDVALHPLPEVLVGSFTFSLTDAPTVLAGYGDLVRSAPDALTAVLSIVPNDAGAAVVMVSPTWSGPLADGYAFMEEFGALAGPLDSNVSVMSPLSALRQLDGMLPDGAQYALRTRNIKALTPEVASTIIDAYGSRHSVGSFLNIHHFHGDATRHTVRDTAFGRRDDHLMLEFIETSPSLSEWTTTAAALFASHALPGGYPNLLGPDEEEQTAAAFGPNAPRLLDIKERLDPEGVFCAISLPARTR